MTYRLLHVLLVCLVLLPAPAAAAAGQWVEYGREYAEVKAYKLLARGAHGEREVLARIACLPGMEETDGCVLALEIYRKLAMLMLWRQVAPRPETPPGGKPGVVTERLTRYTIDCAKERYVPVFIQWNDAHGRRVSRIDYGKHGWRSTDKIPDLAKKVCE